MKTYGDALRDAKFDKTVAPIDAQITTGTVAAQIKPPVVQLWCIEILNDDGDYIAQFCQGPDWIKGYGETPDEALYALCEITAEFGLDAEGRDYPPGIWRLIIFKAESVLSRIRRWWYRHTP